jgi:hypothetical protein
VPANLHLNFKCARAVTCQFDLSAQVESSKYQSTEEAAEDMISFIIKYDPKPERQAKVIFGGSVTRLNKFSVMAEELGLVEKLYLERVQREVFKLTPVLILLDIGGSLMYRHGSPELPKGLDKEPDFKLRGHLHFFRPHYHTFLTTLIQHPRVKLGFYTSITQKNAVKLLFEVFESPYLKPFKGEVFALFDQAYNTKDPGEGRDPWATKRDLAKVFEHPKVLEHGFSWHNTLLVDSDAVKVRDYPANSMILEAYSLEHLLSRFDHQDETLPQVLNEIMHLLNSTDNIQSYLTEKALPKQGNFFEKQLVAPKITATLIDENLLDLGQEVGEHASEQKDAILGQMLADRVKEPLEDMISRLVL